MLPLAVATAGVAATPALDDMFHSDRHESVVQTGTRPCLLDISRYYHTGVLRNERFRENLDLLSLVGIRENGLDSNQMIFYRILSSCGALAIEEIDGKRGLKHWATRKHSGLFTGIFCRTFVEQHL